MAVTGSAADGRVSRGTSDKAIEVRAGKKKEKKLARETPSRKDRTNGPSVFTISAPSRRVSDAPGPRRSHILVVLIVGRRPVEAPVKIARKRETRGPTARVDLIAVGTSRGCNATRSVLSGMSPSLFPYLSIYVPPFPARARSKPLGCDGTLKTQHEMRTRVKRGTDWLGSPVVISGPCVSATCSARMLPLQPSARAKIPRVVLLPRPALRAKKSLSGAICYLNI